MAATFKTNPIGLKSIANNAEIDVIWEHWQAKLEPLREALNHQTDRAYEEWEVPREVQAGWDDAAITLHRDWWDARIARQKEIDASIAKRADVELLYDRPYEDKSKVRVAGPFTVESLSPHRVVPSDADAAWDEVQASEGKRRRNLASAPPADFAQIVLENLKTSGVQQGAKADRIEFTSLTPWPGEYIAAEGRFLEGPEGEQVERRAAIFIGPEFGTTSRPDLTAAAREATDARFDVLIAAAFNFEAHASELNRLGPLQILRAKINPDLHMAGELKNTGKGNLFIVFGEPDVEIETVAGDQLQVKVLGVDVFDPNTGDIRSGDTKSIAFLIRRLISARRHAAKDKDPSLRMQVLAATATISDPGEHLAGLTGLKYEIVSEDQNGAPQHERVVLHVNGADRGGAGELALSDLVEGVSNFEGQRRFIAFIDSRQGTERVATRVGSEVVLPYRSGYEADDRARIEDALQGGGLLGVVSTSALELGIDISDMQIGINLGVPASRKSFRQRIGRVGRSAPGVFLVIAPPTAFLQYGETFEEYFRGSVEPSYLYTGNRFVQFAHARCLLDEQEVLGQDKSSLPAGVDWPEGFDVSLKIARPGGGRSREFDLVAQLGADEPHLNYRLRQIGEATFDLKFKQDVPGNRLGTIAANQAIREAYPGSNYLHLSKPYRVQGWSTSSFERSIRVESTQAYVPTRPILRKSVTFALDHAGVIEGRIKRAGEGLVAEVHLQVNESVEGYMIGRSSYLYRELRAENPNMSRKQRDIRTPGVVIRLNEDWFAGGSGSAPKCREAVAEAFMALLCRERSVASSDVDCVFTNIAVMTDGAPKKVVDAIVIYDTVYGGLRLTEDLFNRFSEYATQLDRAAELAGNAALVSDEVTERIRDWAMDLEDSDVTTSSVAVSPEGLYLVYRPGSLVGVYIQGMLMSRELIAPKLIDLGDGDKQMGYTYSHNGKKSIVRHEEVQPIDDDASFVFWNPITNEYQELDEAGASSNRDSGVPRGWLRVYRPGSVVLVPRHGERVKRVLSVPTMTKDSGGRRRVSYEYADDGGTCFVLHDEIETVGNDWSMILWDPATNQFRESPGDDRD